MGSSRPRKRCAPPSRSCGSSWTTCPRAFAYIDRDYHYRFLNRHNEEWLGVKRSDLTGRTVADVVGEERYRQMKPMFDRVLAGEVVSVEQLLAQPSGEQRWESIHYAPNRDAAGEVIGVYAVHTDIHDQKRNEDALRRANWMLSSHIDNTPLAVLEWDRDFRLVRWSPQAERLFGWRADEVLGHADRRQSAAPRSRSRRGGGAARAADERRRAACHRSHAQHADGWRDDLVRVVSLVPARRSRQHRVDPVVRSGRFAADTRGGAAAAHGHARRADRSSKPRAAAGAARAGDRACEAQRRRVGVLFIDLDRFKNVNDTLGIGSATSC
jgi:PAS domain S-box-containing protein